MREWLTLLWCLVSPRAFARWRQQRDQYAFAAACLAQRDEMIDRVNQEIHDVRVELRAALTLTGRNPTHPPEFYEAPTNPDNEKPEPEPFPASGDHEVERCGCDESTMLRDQLREHQALYDVCARWFHETAPTGKSTLHEPAMAEFNAELAVNVCDVIGWADG